MAIPRTAVPGPSSPEPPSADVRHPLPRLPRGRCRSSPHEHVESEYLPLRIGCERSQSAALYDAEGIAALSRVTWCRCRDIALTLVSGAASRCFRNTRELSGKEHTMDKRRWPAGLQGRCPRLAGSARSAARSRYSQRHRPLAPQGPFPFVPRNRRSTPLAGRAPEILHNGRY